MLYLIVGAVFLISILIGFTTLSVIFLSKRIGSELKERSIELLSPYDLALEDRENKLKELKEEIDKKENKENIIPPTIEEKINLNNISNTNENTQDLLRTIQNVTETKYQDESVYKIYKKIKIIIYLKHLLWTEVD